MIVSKTIDAVDELMVMWHEIETFFNQKNVSSAQKKACVDCLKEMIYQIHQKLIEHTCFFEETGHVTTIPLEPHDAAHSDWYTTICMASCLPRNRKNQSPKTNHFSARQCELSYLGPNNCNLPPKLRFDDSSAVNAWLGPEWLLFIPVLRINRFSTPEEVVAAFRRHVLEIPQPECQKYSDNWLKGKQICVDLSCRVIMAVSHVNVEISSRCFIKPSPVIFWVQFVAKLGLYGFVHNSISISLITCQDLK